MYKILLFLVSVSAKNINYEHIGSEVFRGPIRGVNQDRFSNERIGVRESNFDRREPNLNSRIKRPDLLIEYAIIKHEPAMRHHQEKSDNERRYHNQNSNEKGRQKDQAPRNYPVIEVKTKPNVKNNTISNDTSFKTNKNITKINTNVHKNIDTNIDMKGNIEMNKTITKPQMQDRNITSIQTTNNRTDSKRQKDHEVAYNEVVANPDIEATTEKKWIWNSTDVTNTIETTTPDVGNRDAFKGDQCARGLTRVGTICVPND